MYHQNGKSPWDETAFGWHVLVRISPILSFVIFVNSNKPFLEEKFSLLIMAGCIVKYSSDIISSRYN